MNIIDKINKRQINKDVPNVRTGDTVAVHYKITEGSKTRIQIFKGLCIKTKSPNLLQSSFTLRKRSFGIGVEKTFLSHSPIIKKIDILSSGKVRRAKIFFIRDRVGKKEKLKAKYSHKRK